MRLESGHLTSIGASNKICFRLATFTSRMVSSVPVHVTIVEDSGRHIDGETILEPSLRRLQTEAC